jgi:hypothetical protein
MYYGQELNEIMLVPPFQGMGRDENRMGDGGIGQETRPQGSMYL